MKKNRITLCYFLLILFSIIFTFLFVIPIFSEWLIDKDTRKLTFEEDVKVSNVIENFYFDYFKLDYAKIKELFFEEQVNIRITDGHNLLTDYEYNYFGTIETESDLNRIGGAYNQYVGSLIKKQIVLKEFVNQPYDYPVGNVYYVNVDVQYKNARTYQYFFIINEHNQFKIYEHKIEIL
ncbi:hypothetical protein [Treponema socranskii]|uniref:hypothetical protein n=1 Tax=Treponema socranskii TaxID=53419 RepID=UPI0023F062E9|nr:hypothetical protein [Treponema socranskii]